MTGMDEIGVVVKISGDTAWVKLETGENCSACGSRNHCAQDDSSPQRIVEAMDPLKVQIGQQVQIRVEGSDIIKASLLMFAVPLAFLVLGALLGKFWGSRYAGTHSDTWALLTGLFCLGSALLGIRVFSHRMKKNKSFFPYITRINP